LQVQILSRAPIIFCAAESAAPPLMNVEPRAKARGFSV
jgi:hypothetical protein